MYKDYYFINFILFMLILLNFILILNKNFIFNFLGDWGLGIGDWGLGIGDWARSPIPNPQSPIPNPHLKNKFFKNIYSFNIK